MTLLRYGKRQNDFFTNQLMNQLFKETQDSFKSAVERESGFRPATNVIEEEDYYLIEVAIPGFAKEDVSIKVENGSIKISAEKKETKEDKKYLRREFGVYKFERSFKLADTINQQNISAEVVNGMLNIVLPKIEENKPEVHNIEIK
ncbi:Hsp20/alpha crystallin family protein [Marinifilum sp. D714]|uniref:Hsp20/alpha crystallin family protein n=1 Tax=Marinifilum sp. D714 TaxID=2937523 RepID=UPI0027CDA549|nr:Hsp20/alpha crystallin family protein [Marinifilum sp. D714]MDQ2178511.1 Hsp20/alpha crystallin family protein [Marinifilum sp. D714]